MHRYFVISDKPYCRPNLQDVYGVATRETIRIPCDVISDPNDKVTYEWVFNTSTEWYPMKTEPGSEVGVSSSQRGWTRAYVEHTPKVHKAPDFDHFRFEIPVTRNEF